MQPQMHSVGVPRMESREKGNRACAASHFLSSSESSVKEYIYIYTQGTLLKVRQKHPDPAILNVFQWDMRFVFSKLTLYSAAFGPFGSIWGSGTNPPTRLMISAWVISALPGRRHSNGWCILHKAIVSWEQTCTSSEQPKRLFSWGWNCPYKSVCQVHICSLSNSSFGIETCSTWCKCSLIPNRIVRKKKWAFESVLALYNLTSSV